MVAFGFWKVKHEYALIFLKFIYGYCYGFSMPLSVSSVTEIMPLAYRGKSIICMNFFTSVGKLVALILAYFCFTDMKSGDWRLLMLYNGIIAILGPIFIGIFFIESPRYLIAIGKYDEGLNNLT